MVKVCWSTSILSPSHETMPDAFRWRAKVMASVRKRSIRFIGLTISWKPVSLMKRSALSLTSSCTDGPSGDSAWPARYSR